MTDDQNMNIASLKTQLKLTIPQLHKLKNFWRWWLAELGDMLPESIRAARLTRFERLYLDLNGEEVIASRCVNGTLHETGRYSLAAESLPPEQVREVTELDRQSHEIILCLPADKVLLKTMDLPLVAETNLREVLGFEMDRQTPFTAEQVYYDQIINKRNVKKSSLSLELVVTPRKYLDTQLAKLEQIGLLPHQVSIRRDENTLPLNLLPEEARKRMPGSAKHLNITLGVLALLLLMGIIILPLVNKTRLIDQLESRIANAADKVTVVRRLNNEVERLNSGSVFLVNKKQARPLVVEIINELTHILPDDTWINRLLIKGDEIQIFGQSTTAAALIPLIESSDSLYNPRFRSSVTSSQGSNAERFHLSAEVTGGASK